MQLLEDRVDLLVVKCAISLFNSYFSNVTKQVALFTALSTGTFLCDLWCVYIGGGGQKEVLHKRQSSDLGTLEVESIGICSIEIGIARKKETSHNRSYGFPSNLTLITFIYQNYNRTNLCVTIFIY